MNIFVSIAGLAFLILIHEAGHFFVARAVRMRPRKFYVFFPPVLVRKVHNGIEYGLGAIPLGGYVKIPGMHRPAGRDLEGHYRTALDDAPSLRPHVDTAVAVLDHDELDEPRAARALADLRRASDGVHLSEQAKSRVDKGLTDVEDGLSPEAYWRAPVWKRIAVIAAGPITNLLFAVAMLAVVFGLGVPRAASKVVDQVVSGTPAETIGLLSGDEVIAVDGTGVVTFDDVSSLIRSSDGDPITLTVLRGGTEIVLGPRAAELSDGRYRLGFIPGVTYESFGPVDAVGEAFKETGNVTVAIGRSLSPHRHARGSRGHRDADRHRPGHVPDSRAGLPRLPRDSRADQPVARALEPAAAPAARRRAHPVFGDRARSAACDTARGLRTRIDDRHRARPHSVCHRAYERHRPPERLDRWAFSAQPGYQPGNAAG